MRKNKIALTICLAVLLIGGFFVFVWPQYQKYSAKSLDLAIKQKELDAKEEYFRKIDETLLKLKERQNDYDKISAAFPNEFSAPEVFDFLQKKTSENGLALKEIKSGIASASKINPKMKENTIMLSVIGRYDGLKNFLNAIYESSRMLEIGAIKFSSPAQGSKQTDIYDFELTIKAHSY